jgi:hypothetical protein
VRTVSVPAAVRTLISNPNRSMCVILGVEHRTQAENASSWPSHPPRPFDPAPEFARGTEQIYRLETTMPDARDMALSCNRIALPWSRCVRMASRTPGPSQRN